MSSSACTTPPGPIAGGSERNGAVGRGRSAREEGAAGPRGGVGEEEGVRGRPPRDEVDVLQQGDAVVEGDAEEGEGDAREVRRRGRQNKRGGGVRPAASGSAGSVSSRTELAQWLRSGMDDVEDMVY